MAWDFERGGLVEPSPRRDVVGLPDALRRVLGAPGAAYAQGLALGLRGVSQAYGLGWRVEVDDACVVVKRGRAKVRLAHWLTWHELPPWGKKPRNTVEALCLLAGDCPKQSAPPLHI